MLRTVINGAFYSMRMQGVVRYARELVKSLDDIISSEDEVVVVIPFDAKNVPTFSNIIAKRIGHLTGFAWEQVDLPIYMALHRDSMLLNLCNVAPLFTRSGITAIHDIMYRVRPDFYNTFRNKLSSYWHRIQYRLITDRERAIITVSDYSKQELEKYYPESINKTYVVPNSWQHVLSYKSANDWLERYPFLEPGNYYFSMATLARNKNGRWVYEVAKRNADQLFVIAGKRYESDEISCPSNVHLIGFVSDEDACSLILNCRAFLFPSLYEGFGLPPLEALALGAEVISSNTTSLPEVLGNAVYYISPDDYEINLEELISSQKHGDKNEVLYRYSWDKSAQKLLRIMSRFIFENDSLNMR